MKNSAKNFFRLCISLIITALLLCSISSICFADNGDTIVYVTNSGYAYHIGSCYHLRSKNAITLRQATIDGYHPCKDCQPPIFNGILPAETQPPKPINNGSGGSGGDSGSSSSSSSGSSSGSGGSSSTQNTAGTETSTEKATEDQARKRIGTVEIIIIVFLIMIFGSIFMSWLCSMIYCMFKEIIVKKKRKKELNERVKVESQNLLDGLIILQKRLRRLSENQSELQPVIREALQISKRNLDEFIDQRGVEMSFNGLPMIKDGVYPYGKLCTAFYYERSTVYHKHGCNCLRSKRYIVTHMLNVPKNLSPCKHCHPEQIDTSWMRHGKDLWDELQEAIIANDYFDRFYNEKINNDRIYRINKMAAPVFKFCYKDLLIGVTAQSKNPHEDAQSNKK